MLNTRKRRPDLHCPSFKNDTDRLLTGQTINKLIISAAKVGAVGQQMRKNVLNQTVRQVPNCDTSCSMGATAQGLWGLQKHRVEGGGGACLRS